MLVRDEKTQQIVSYTEDSIQKNQGFVEVPVIDGRYLRSEFTYIIDNRFKSLPEAISSEANLNRKLDEIEKLSLTSRGFGSILPGAAIPPDNWTAEEKKEYARQQFLKDLGNLVNEDENSTIAMKAKIRSLENEISRKDSIIDDQLTNISKFDDVLASVSNERAMAIAKADSQRDATIAIQKQNDEKLFKMEIEVERQRKESAQAASDLKTALVDNISAQNTKQDAQITNLRTQTTQLASSVNTLSVDNTRQDGEIKQAGDVANTARQQANTNAFKINDANARVRNVRDTDTSKQAIDKIFPI
jgi:hypothetical protein